MVLAGAAAIAALGLGTGPFGPGRARFGVGTAYADSVASNAGATSIASRSAVLHGVAHTTDTDSAVLFQYGRTTSYGHATPPKTIGAGRFAESARITGLAPGATYHFRFVVEQGSYPSTLSASSDLTFTTRRAPAGAGRHPRSAQPARLSLPSRVLHVRSRRVSIPIRCTGPTRSRCRGEIHVSSRRTLRKVIHTVDCASATFSVSSGNRRLVTATLGRACQSLLRGAPGHRIHATLRASLNPHQRALTAPVTLAG